MSDNRKVIFFLYHNNDVDQLTPVIYRIAQQVSFPVDVVLWETDIKKSDYRLNIIKSLRNVTTHSHINKSGSEEGNKYEDILVEKLKDVGRATPTNIPERIYDGLTGRRGSISEDADSENSKELVELIQSLTRGFNNVVVALDWSLAHYKYDQMSELREQDVYTTVVLPHGDAPFWNAMEQQKLHFEKLLEDETAFTEKANLDKIARKVFFGVTSSHYDYHVMPNEANARRIRPFVKENQIKILGSPRYNQEWLDVLSEHRPDHNLPSTDKLKVVMFNRGDEKYNILNKEVENTIRLVTRFPNVYLIVKEHPRFSLIDPSSELRDISNLKIIEDEVESASLVEWGDVFLELGTTIAFEPVMRGKPVLSLSYTHSNYATIAHYFSDSDIRCKDDLYYAFHDLIDKGCSDFYDEEEHHRFVREMITSGHDSVLNAYADFLEACLDKNSS